MTTTYVPCHDNNAYFHAFAEPNKILIAGSKGLDVWPDCDLIVNLDANFRPMVGVTPAAPPPPPKPLLTFSNKDWAGLAKYIIKPDAKKMKDLSEIKKKPDYIDVLWPDMKVPMLSYMFWVKLYEMVTAKSKEKPEEDYEVLFTCQGGHGRTGTSMCCFLVGSRAYNPLTAIQFVRENYCKSAVENVDQETYLWAVGAAIMKSDNKEEEEIDTLKKKYKSWCDKNYSKSSVASSYHPPSSSAFNSQTPLYGPAKGSNVPQVWDYKTNKWLTQDEIDAEMYV